jgi:hypothetical protein
MKMKAAQVSGFFIANALKSGLSKKSPRHFTSTKLNCRGYLFGYLTGKVPLGNRISLKYLCREGFKELNDKKSIQSFKKCKMKINQEMSILFWLFKAKKTVGGKCPIYCRITVNGKRAEFSTGKKIEMEKWLADAGVVKGNSIEAQTVNKELSTIKP